MLLLLDRNFWSVPLVRKRRAGTPGEMRKTCGGRVESRGGLFVRIVCNLMR